MNSLSRFAGYSSFSAAFLHLVPQLISHLHALSGNNFSFLNSLFFCFEALASLFSILCQRNLDIAEWTDKCDSNAERDWNMLSQIREGLKVKHKCLLIFSSSFPLLLIPLPHQKQTNKQTFTNTVLLFNQIHFCNFSKQVWAKEKKGQSKVILIRQHWRPPVRFLSALWISCVL